MVNLREMISMAYNWAFFEHNVTLPIPSNHLTRMRTFSPVDLPHLLVFGIRRWLHHMSLVSRFRRNLTLADWTSLSDLYARPVMLFYYYTVFLWARYCDVLDTVLAEPDKCIVAELFLRYNCELDSMIDCPEGPTRLRADPWFPKRASGTRALASELWKALHAAGLPRTAEREVLRLARSYRQTYLRTMQRAAVEPIVTLTKAQILEDKSRIAGGIWGTWSRILGWLYSVPHPRAERAEAIFQAYGMIIQVLDDTADLPKDVADNQANLLYAFVKNVPDEAARLEALLHDGVGPFLSTYWERVNLPHAYAQAWGLMDEYLAAIESLDPEGRITPDFLDFLDVIRHISNCPPRREALLARS